MITSLGLPSRQFTTHCEIESPLPGSVAERESVYSEPSSISAALPEISRVGATSRTVTEVQYSV